VGKSKIPHTCYRAYLQWLKGLPVSLDLIIEIPDILDRFLWLSTHANIALTNQGFETGDFTGWTTAGAVTVIATDPKCGTYHMRANVVSGAAARAHQSFSTATTIYTRMFVQRKSSTYDSHNLEIALLTDGGPPGTRAWGLFLRFSNDEFRLEVPHGAGTVYHNTGVTATVDTWFCIEVLWIKHATTGGFQIWIDTVDEGSNFGLDTSAYTPDIFLYGNTANWGTTGDWDMYFDHVVMDDADQIGCACPSVGWTGKISGVTNPAKIMGVDVANIDNVKGVA